jgi:hypothetical protein
MFLCQFDPPVMSREYRSMGYRRCIGRYITVTRDNSKLLILFILNFNIHCIFTMTHMISDEYRNKNNNNANIFIIVA